MIGNAIWFLLAGWWPFGRDIVDLDQARRLGYATQVVVPTNPSHPTR